MSEQQPKPAGEASREPAVSMQVVWAVVNAVERAGVARGELLRAAGIEAAQLEVAEARMTRARVAKICEAALDLSGDPALGLHWAETLTRSTFAPISYLMAHSASLRHGFESLSRFERLLSDEPGFELFEQADEATLRCPPLAGESPLIQRFSAEMRMGSFFWIIRRFAPHARLVRASFEYSAPAYHDEYTRIFDRAEHFEQPFTGLVFDRALLDVASPHKDEDIHEVLAGVAERRMFRLAERAPYALRVRELLVERGWPERIDMQTVAQALGLSVRSLRRRLASEGQSYNDLENDAFAIAAKQRLGDKKRSIQETAYEMGFSDTTTFHRAFKRATGTTPSKYLETRLGGEPR